MMLSAVAVTFTVLTFTSAILCIAMLLAWMHFGRRPYALSWALAYGCGMLQWAINATGNMVFKGHPVPLVIASMLAITSSSLVLIGCRQRAGLPEHYGRLIAGAGFTGALITSAYTLFPHYGLRVGVTNLYIAIMFLIAIKSLYPANRRPSPPEIGLLVMLTVFALFQILLTTLSLSSGPSGANGVAATVRTVMIIGVPPIVIGTGIAALFLLAGDLAESVRHLATRDSLTGVLNRRGLEQAATSALASARRRGRPLALVIGDIDRFKSINDRFGHLAGDQALAAFAAHVQGVVREEDMFARLGGDEFCIILVDATEKQAMATVERIRATLAGLELPEHPGLTLSASFGVTGFQPGDTCFSDMLRRADLALYDSKIGGRNRTTVAQPLVLAVAPTGTGG